MEEEAWMELQKRFLQKIPNKLFLLINGLYQQALKLGKRDTYQDNEKLKNALTGAHTLLKILEAVGDFKYDEISKILNTGGIKIESLEYISANKNDLVELGNSINNLLTKLENLIKDGKLEKKGNEYIYTSGKVYIEIKDIEEGYKRIYGWIVGKNSVNLFLIDAKREKDGISYLVYMWNPISIGKVPERNYGFIQISLIGPLDIYPIHMLATKIWKKNGEYKYRIDAIRDIYLGRGKNVMKFIMKHAAGGSVIHENYPYVDSMKKLVNNLNMIMEKISRQKK